MSTAAVAPPELVAEVLAALIEARDAPTPAAALAAYDRLGRSPRFLRWLAERDVLGVTAVAHPTVDTARRHRPNPTRAMWNACLARDGYRCRYCGLPALTAAGHVSRAGRRHQHSAACRHWLSGGAWTCWLYALYLSERGDNAS